MVQVKKSKPLAVCNVCGAFSDEYQDVNPVQARIVRVLAGDRPNSLFAVGDPKQSIYRFRGAAISNILEFTNVYSETSRIVLRQNFR